VPTVHFTVNLQRHVKCASMDVEGSTVQQVLQAVFAAVPQMRGYVVDDQGAVRKHMNIFVDGEQILDRLSQSDEVSSGSEIYIMQALSGG